MRMTIAILLIAFTCVPTPARAQQAPQIGLYVDSTHTEHCAWGTADYYPVDVYVWFRPGENGMKAMWFQILYPDIVIPAYIVLNEEILLGIDGTPQSGIGVFFEECQNDWVWALRHTVLLISEEPGLVQLYPSLRFINCPEEGAGYLETANRVSNVCINFCTEDVEPPRIADLYVVDDMTLEITFTEQVTAESAEDIDNYLVYSRYIEADSIFPVTAGLLPGDTTVVLGFAEMFGCYPDKVFRSSYVADTVGNMWELLEPFVVNTSIYSDLTVLESIYEDTLAGCEDEFVVSCEIMNIGICSSPPSRVQLYYDGLTEEGILLETTDFGYMTFPEIAAGDTAAVEFLSISASTRNHTLKTHGMIRLVVDPVDDVDELDEDNNEHESPLIVLPPREVTYELVGDSVRAEFGKSPLDGAGIAEPVTSYEVLWSDEWEGDYEIAGVLPADGSPEYMFKFPMTTDRYFSAVYTRAVRFAGGDTFYYDNCREWIESGVDLPPEPPKMGLYIDSTRTDHCSPMIYKYYPLDVYVWAAPGENGMEAMMFQILFPDNVIPAYIANNEAIVIDVWGVPRDGVRVTFGECQDDWAWAMCQTVLLVTEDPGLIQLYPAQHPFNSDPIRFEIDNCLGYGYETSEPAERVSNVCINFCSEDVDPPLIEELQIIDYQTLEVTFTEEVTAESAEEIQNYLVYNMSTEQDTVLAVSADLLPGDTTVTLVFADPFTCYPDMVFRCDYVADPVGNTWVLIEPFSVTTGYADLVVQESTHVDTLAGCEDAIVVSCTIMNAGLCFVPPSRVQLYYDGLSEEGAVLETTDFGYKPFGGLMAGGTVVVEFDTFDTRVLNHTFHAHGKFRLVVDPDDYVDELDEFNNEYESPLVVLPPRNVTYELVGDSLLVEFGRALFDSTETSAPVTSYEIYWNDIWGGEYDLAAVVPADGSSEYSCKIPMTTGRKYSAVFTHAVRPVSWTAFYYQTCREWHETGANMPPAAPTGFSAVPAGDDMYLEWVANAEPDIMFYVLQWSPNGEFPPVSDPPGYPYGEEISANDFTHEGWDPGDVLIYRLCAVDSEGNCSDYAFANSWGGPTDDLLTPVLPLTLHQNHPNPFNPTTTISFYLPGRCRVRLEVFDISGRSMATLIDDSVDKGPQSAVWTGNDRNGNTAASGVYFYRLSAGRETISKKMVLLR